MASHKYIVVLGIGSEQTYMRLQHLAEFQLSHGETANYHVALFRKLEDLLERVLPQDPFNRERALSGPLANVFRVTDEPIRVYYCGAPNEAKITVIRIADTPLKINNTFRAKWMMAHADENIVAALADNRIQLPKPN